MITGDLVLDIHYTSIVLAIIVPLYYWYWKKERNSPVLKVARAVRVVNAALYLAAAVYALDFFWNEIDLGLWLIVAMVVVAYLLARRWAPRERSPESAV